MIKEMCCIVCPMSCHIQVECDDNQKIISVKGNSCPRGEAYARSEAIDPQRMVTTTIRIHHASLPLLPVITSKTISKSKIFEVMEVCKHLEVEAPIEVQSILVKNIAGTGADLIASRSMQKQTELQ